MSEVTIYHNPRCSKSRQTLALLNERGISPNIIRYLEAPPDAATIEGLLALLNLEPRALMRKKEAPYTDLALDDEALPNAALIQAMVDHPVLIERPIVLAGDKDSMRNEGEHRPATRSRVLKILPRRRRKQPQHASENPSCAQVGVFHASWHARDPARVVPRARFRNFRASPTYRARRTVWTNDGRVGEQ